MRGGSDGNWLSVRVRLLLALSAIAVILPGAAGIFGLAAVRTSLAEGVREGQIATAQSVSVGISRGLDVARDLVKSAAASPDLEASISGRDVPALSVVLQELYATRPVFRAVGIRDSGGDLVAAFPSMEALRSGPVPGGSPVAAGTDGLLAVDAAVGAEGRVVGLVSLARLAPEARDLRFGRTGSVTLVNRNADVIISGEPARVGKRLTAPQNLALVREWRGGTSTYYSRIVDRDEVAAFEPVERSDLAVLVTVAQAEAFAGARRVEAGLVVGLTLLLLVGLGVAFLVTQTLSKYEKGLREQIDEQSRLNDALEGFAARVAHDLRSPLGNMKMAAELVKRAATEPNPRLDAGLQLIDSGATRSIKLVEDLLDLARASGTPRLEMIRVSDVVAEASEGIEDVNVTDSTDGIVMEVDRVAFRQALINLFGNAGRYNDKPGPVEVNISGQLVDGGVEISVADSGPGLDRQDINSIFEPFVRGTAKDQPAGSGLGLAIVAAMADAHGGRVSYETATSGGAQFKIWIPGATVARSSVRRTPRARRPNLTSDLNMGVKD